MGDPSQLESLLDHSRDVLSVLSVDGRHTYLTAAVEEVLGYAPAELEGEYAFDYVHPNDVDAVRSAFESIIGEADQTTVTVRYRHRCADGSWTWLESRVSSETGSELDGYVISSRDISDRLAAEQSSERTTRWMHALSATSSDVMWLFSADWSELLFVNSAVEDVYGIAPEELYREPTAFLDSVHPDDTERVLNAMELLSDGERVQLEYRVNQSEGFERRVWVKATPVTEAGEVTAIAGLSRDVTVRYHREEHLRAMDHLLRHNLRNDLNVIFGIAEQVAAESPEHADAMDRIVELGTQLLERADTQREIIQLLTAEAPNSLRSVQLVVESAVRNATDARSALSVETRGLREAAGRVPVHLEHAVTELLTNVCDRCESSPRAVVSVGRTDDVVELTVEDEGRPLSQMDADVLEGASRNDTLDHGSELGLWLVYWSVEFARGTVDVEEASEERTRITLRVPGSEDRSPLTALAHGSPTVSPSVLSED